MLPAAEQRQIVWIILEAIGRLEAGKGKITAFLKSSHSKIISEPQLDRKTGYGALFWLDLATIHGFITQLEEMELIETQKVRTANYSYPILTLTNAGRKALNEKIEVPLQIKKETRPESSMVSEKLTLELFQMGRTILEICTERKLKPSTIYTHFSNLIEKGMLKAQDLIYSETIDLILKAKKEHSNKKSVGDLKAVLPSYISYDEIRCVLNDKSLNP